MVVRINTGESMRGALSYNENKVRLGNAELLLASGFGCEIDQLGFSEKLKRFELLNARRPTVETNTLHLSINFHPDEEPTDEVLRSIAREYMAGIGFGDQPFLVYRHKDAGHDHIHIVTNTVRSNGTAISLHNLGRGRSTEVRKNLENEYNLIHAEGRGKDKKYDEYTDGLLPSDATRATTKNRISNILGMVIKNYKFATLREFDAILRTKNITVDPGLPGSKMEKNGGLVYCRIDKDGNKTGVSIKASAFHSIKAGAIDLKPTLKNLQLWFRENRKYRDERLPESKAIIQEAILQTSVNNPIERSFKKHGLVLLSQKDHDGGVTSYEIVDNVRKVVVSDRELSIAIPAPSLTSPQQPPTQPSPALTNKEAPTKIREKTTHSPQSPTSPSGNSGRGAVAPHPSAPGGALIDEDGEKKRRRRKKKGLR